MKNEIAKMKRTAGDKAGELTFLMIKIHLGIHILLVECGDGGYKRRAAVLAVKMVQIDGKPVDCGRHSGEIMRTTVDVNACEGGIRTRGEAQGRKRDELKLEGNRRNFGATHRFDKKERPRLCK